jgi:hypothetical protein
MRPITWFGLAGAMVIAFGMWHAQRQCGFLSSPLIVLSKRLKLPRNVLVGHCLGRPEYGPCRVKYSLLSISPPQSQFGQLPPWRQDGFPWPQTPSIPAGDKMHP